MNRIVLCSVLLCAAAGTHAEPWTYLGTTTGIADGNYAVRLTFLESGSYRVLAEPVTVADVAIVNDALAFAFDSDVIHDSVGTLTLRIDLVSEGKPDFAVTWADVLDQAAPFKGACWIAGPDGSKSPRRTSACLFPTDSVAKAGPSGGAYELAKQVIASGGQAMSAGSFAMVGTIGQSAVTVVSGGAYHLTGGFHGAPAAPRPDSLFANGFEN